MGYTRRQGLAEIHSQHNGIPSTASTGVPGVMAELQLSRSRNNRSRSGSGRRRTAANDAFRPPDQGRSGGRNASPAGGCGTGGNISNSTWII